MRTLAGTHPIHHTYVMEGTKLWISLITSLALFLGGLVLFLAHSAFWSIFVGVPAIQIGIVFLIFTFEKSSQNEVDREDEQEELRKLKHR